MEHRRTFEHQRSGHQAFGRRIPAHAVAPSSAASPASPVQAASILSPTPGATMLPSVEDEIAAWRASRGAVVGIPWRQLSLMAGLCFGIASFVLPTAVNEALQWPLYALTAVSLYAGLRKHKSKPA